MVLTSLKFTADKAPESLAPLSGLEVYLGNYFVPDVIKAQAQHVSVGKRREADLFTIYRPPKLPGFQFRFLASTIQQEPQSRLFPRLPDHHGLRATAVLNALETIFWLEDIDGYQSRHHVP